MNPSFAKGATDLALLEITIDEAFRDTVSRCGGQRRTRCSASEYPVDMAGAR